MNCSSSHTIVTLSHKRAAITRHSWEDGLEKLVLNREVAKHTNLVKRAPPPNIKNFKIILIF